MKSEKDALILTPEHVQIRLIPAGLGSRFLALVLDFILIAALSILLAILLGLFLPAGLANAIFLTLTFVLTWGYHIYFEVWRQGRTPGKRATGLRVVDSRGLPINFQQSFVRNIVRVLDFVPVLYGLGALVALFNRHGRRLGDIAADTLVITESQPLGYGIQLAKSRQFNSLKVPRITRFIRHRISLEEREFLLTLCLRAEKMEEKSRFDMMEEVGSFYRKKLEIDDPHLSGENLVRALTAILFEKPASYN